MVKLITLFASLMFASLAHCAPPSQESIARYGVSQRRSGHAAFYGPSLNTDARRRAFARASVAG
jgi:hypothetical protein